MGRRRGLKIPRGSSPCEFESRLRHHRKEKKEAWAVWSKPFYFALSVKFFEFARPESDPGI